MKKNIGRNNMTPIFKLRMIILFLIIIIMAEIVSPIIKKSYSANNDIEVTSVELKGKDNSLTGYGYFELNKSNNTAKIYGYYEVKDWNRERTSYSIVIPSIVKNRVKDDNKTYTVTGIGKEAFMQQSKISSVVLPEGIKTIETRSFYNCKGLKEINLPVSLNTIENGVFCGCTNLKKIQMYNGVKTIGNGVFSGCTALNEVIISNSVESIGQELFSSCKNLTITFLSSLSINDIGANMFYRCRKYKS